MKKLLFIFTCFLGTLCFAQNDTILMLHHLDEEEGLMLKWVPKTSEVFFLGFEKGYNLYKAEVQKTNSGGEKIGAFEKLNQEPLKYWSLDKVEEAMKKDSAYETALLLVGNASDIINNPEATNFSEALTKKEGDDFLHLIATMGVIVNNESAEALGMYFVDKSSLTAEKYVYKLELIDHPELTSHLLVFPKSAKIDTKIRGISGQLLPEAAYLQWYNDENKDYPYHNIYRSEKKSSGYVKLNDLPYVDVNSPSADAQVNRSAYVDSFPEYNKKYYYKVVGVNAFGKEGRPSEIVEIETFYLLQSTPQIVSSEDEGSDITLTWEMDYREEEYVSGYSVFYSQIGGGAFTQVNEKRLSAKTRSFTDKEEKGSSNYYIVSAYGENGDSTNSVMKAHLLLDSIPPETPTILYGTCDTSGIITLKWTSNDERDFLGYRIFKTYDKKMDALRVQNEFYEDTVITDTVDVKRPYRKIYYRLSSFDQHFNPSIPTPYFEVIIPDLVPPSNGYFKDYSVGMHGITLNWQKSPAFDLKAMKILRKSDVDVTFREIASFEGENLEQMSYTDTTTKSFQTYQYRLIAVDGAGLKSEPTKSFVIEQLDKRKVASISNLEAIVSKENKLVKLKWVFNGNAKGYRIYRSVNDGPLTTYKYIKGNVREYYDKWLKPNTQYTYLLVAELNGGYKSGSSKRLEVKY